MATDQPNDAITTAVLSETAYERLRLLRASHFTQSLPRKLAIHGSLLALLGVTLPLFLAYPSTAARYLSSTDPVTAAPKVAVLGLFGGVLVFCTAGLLVGVGWYRLTNAPLDEGQAHAVLTAEDFASYLGVGTGGLAIAVTLAMFALGLGGAETLGAYVETMNGRNPMAGAGYGVTVAHLGVGALAASAVVLGARTYLKRRLAALG